MDTLAELGSLLRRVPKDLIAEAIALPSEEPSTAVLWLLAAILGDRR